MGGMMKVRNLKQVMTLFLIMVMVSSAVNFIVGENQISFAATNSNVVVEKIESIWGSTVPLNDEARFTIFINNKGSEAVSDPLKGTLVFTDSGNNIVQSYNYTLSTLGAGETYKIKETIVFSIIGDYSASFTLSDEQSDVEVHKMLTSFAVEKKPAYFSQYTAFNYPNNKLDRLFVVNGDPGSRTPDIWDHPMEWSQEDRGIYPDTTWGRGHINRWGCVVSSCAMILKNKGAKTLVKRDDFRDESSQKYFLDPDPFTITMANIEYPHIEPKNSGARYEIEGKAGETTLPAGTVREGDSVTEIQSYEKVFNEFGYKVAEETIYSSILERRRTVAEWGDYLAELLETHPEGIMARYPNEHTLVISGVNPNYDPAVHSIDERFMVCDPAGVKLISEIRYFDYTTGPYVNLTKCESYGMDGRKGISNLTEIQYIESEMTSDKKTEYIAAEIKKLGEEPEPVHSHTWVDGHVITPGTCLQREVVMLLCSCDESRPETRDYGAHVPKTTETTTHVNPCTDSGTKLTVEECDTCDTELNRTSETVNPKGHMAGLSWEPWIIDKEPNCYEIGARHRINLCTREGCNSVADREDEVIANTLVHDASGSWGAWITDSSPKCSSTGTKHRVKICAISGCNAQADYASGTIPETGHGYSGSWSSWSVDRNATCTSVGTKSRVQICSNSNCNVQVGFDGEVISSLGHAYDSWGIDIGPTCTKSGRERRDCSRCPNYETRTVSATGHGSFSYIGYKTAHPHAREYKCGHYGCSYVKTSGTYNAGTYWDGWAYWGSSYPTPTCTTSGKQVNNLRCSECNQWISNSTRSISPLGHSYGSLVYVKTYYSGGFQYKQYKRTCTRSGCGHVTYATFQL